MPPYPMQSAKFRIWKFYTSNSSVSSTNKWYNKGGGGGKKQTNGTNVMEGLCLDPGLEN